MKEERVVIMVISERSVESANAQFEKLAGEGFILTETKTHETDKAVIYVYRFTRETIPVNHYPYPYYPHDPLRPPYTITCAVSTGSISTSDINFKTKE